MPSEDMLPGVSNRGQFETWQTGILSPIEDIEMIKRKVLFCFPILLLAAAGFASTQEPNPTATQPQSQSNAVPMTQVGVVDDVPLYRIQVVGRDIPAINYFHRSGSTRIGFQGTSLLPQATGTAKVESRLGRTSIDARGKPIPNMRPAFAARTEIDAAGVPIPDAGPIDHRW